jgi:hypothetical protein
MFSLLQADLTTQRKWPALIVAALIMCAGMSWILLLAWGLPPTQQENAVVIVISLLAISGSCFYGLWLKRRVDAGETPESEEEQQMNRM